MSELVGKHTIVQLTGLLAVGNGFVNKTIGTTQRVASDTTQEQSTDEKNQTDRIRHHES